MLVCIAFALWALHSGGLLELALTASGNCCLYQKVVQQSKSFLVIPIELPSQKQVPCGCGSTFGGPHNLDPFHTIVLDSDAGKHPFWNTPILTHCRVKNRWGLPQEDALTMSRPGAAGALAAVESGIWHGWLWLDERFRRNIKQEKLHKNLICGKPNSPISLRLSFFDARTSGGTA